MNAIKTPNKIVHPIYRAEFRYTSPTDKIDLYSDRGAKLKSGAKLGTKRISEFTDREVRERLIGNIMEVGEPEFWNLKELCERKEIKLPVEIKMLFDKFDFWLIQSAFSFMPAHGNQFHWARIVAKLESLSENMKNPITYDVYPKDIYVEKKEKHRISIGLSLKFAEIIEPKAEYVQEIEFTRLEPVIAAAGIGKSNPTWDFSGRAAFNLKDVNVLYIIIKIPIKSEGMKINYFSHSLIHTNWGGIIPTGTEKLSGEETYEIKF